VAEARKEIKKDPLKAYRQHGFIQLDNSGGNQETGTCPFCGKDHFFANVETKAWDCKTCGKHGGYKTFLREIVKHCQQFFKGDAAITLSKARGISIPTLRARGIGFNPATQKYTIPIPDRVAGEMWNVLTYQPGSRAIVTAGGEVGLFGWEQDIDSADTIWLCEGEWDGMAWMETLAAKKVKGEIALAVPGALTFKAEWASLFKGKRVHVLYDHDKPGRDGAKKVYATIKTIAKELDFLHWPEDDNLADGYDIRDAFLQAKRDRGPDLYDWVTDLLSPYPPGTDLSALGGDAPGEAKASKYTGQGVPWADVIAAYRKWLWLPDPTVIDFMYGVLIANRWPGDMVWGFIVGPSGCGKSELLMSIADAVDIYSTTSMTPHSLVSGAPGVGGGDPSLIPKLNGKILNMKDFTAVLNMNQNDREAIFGFLRDAYDGETGRDFGNGIVRHYKSRFGIISGVTPAIEMFTEEQTALGERFLRFPFPTPRTLDHKVELASRAKANQRHKTEMQAELNAMGKAVLNFDFGAEPDVPDAIDTKILYCAQYTALMRSTVPRDKFTREITHRPFTEVATRLTTQYFKLCQGIGAFRRKKVVGPEEYDIIRRIAIGTVPSRMETFLRAMYEAGQDKGYNPKQIGDLIDLPSPVAVRIAENLTAIKAIRKTGQLGSRPEYSMNADVLTMIEKAGLYTPKKGKPNANQKK
jgi:hypothetical protein